MAELKVAFEDYRNDSSETALTIYADKNISHGTISSIVQMARDVGLERVNLGVGER